MNYEKIGFETELVNNEDIIYARLEKIGVNVQVLRESDLSTEQLCELHSYLLRIIPGYRLKT
jgi:hypothetical protein